MTRLRRFGQQVSQYPSAIVGLAIIGALIALSIYTVLTIPYAEAIQKWQAGDAVWEENPRNAAPIWTDWVTARDLPETIVRTTEAPSESQAVTKTTSRSDDLKEVEIALSFDYQADAFPKELTLFLNPQFESRRPFVQMAWHTPDGREISLGQQGISPNQRISLSQNSELRRKLGNVRPEVGLFTPPAVDAEAASPLKGRYELTLSGLLFEDDADLDARLIVYGQVHGLAGTDHRRRDLSLALMWGTPIALAFGFLAALGASLLTFIISGIGAWYRGWVDAVIQRITEVFLILPPLVILILVGTLYSRSLWTMLLVLIGLNIFSAGIKTQRAIFLQVRESSYIEAAQAYGAGNWRVIWRYMLPRVVPILIPQFVTLIPAFVFLEASLAVLGLGDPVLPTWGKILDAAQKNGALFKGYYYWVLEPSVMLLVTGFGIAMFGFALDRIFNPRLRVE